MLSDDMNDCFLVIVTIGLTSYFLLLSIIIIIIIIIIINIIITIIIIIVTIKGIIIIKLNFLLY